MKYTISTKHCSLSDKNLKHIEKHVAKINHMLPNLDTDEAQLDLLLRENKKRRLDHVRLETFEEDHTEKTIENINPKASDPIYFDGTIRLVLPKKPLAVHLKGASIDEAINVGFERLFKEIETYKGKHYADDSEYFDHTTIRHNSPPLGEVSPLAEKSEEGI